MTQKPLPWLMLASVYTTQYIGVAFILSAAVAILRQQGLALDKLALLNLAAIPLAGKVLYAPFIDKHRLLFQGQYRSWLLVAQTGMTVLLLLAGGLDLEHEFSILIVLLLGYGFCMSIQDVAIDGLTCKIFDQETRKFANSIQISGNLLGNILGGGIILMLYPWLNWQGALWLLAGITALALIQVVLFEEPEHQSQLTKELNVKLWHNIKDFIKQQKSWFIILAIYPLGFTSGFAILNPMLVDSGWELADIGFATKVFGSIVGLFSAGLAVFLLARLGRIKALISLTVTQAIGLVVMLPLTHGHTDSLMVYIAISAYFLSFPAILVVLSTIAMDKAVETSHKATFFTLQFSFVSLMGFLYTGLSMAAAKFLGYKIVILLGISITFGIAALLYFVLSKKTNC